ncbi:hypothetical protein NDA01_23235 [Trichocoleus desertorum AS-A10]|uniref:hypothetical protein n=1 Tax=Trichocoleus desertorum TaxID=1481672 RepID=UPI00329A1EE8
MDWTTPLRCQQVDFIRRLKLDGAVLSHLKNHEVRGYHSELTVISGAELKEIDEFCWHMVDRYKNQRPSSEIYINNIKGKLGELVIEKYLDQLVTPIDLKKKAKGDGGIDFRLNSDPNVCLQVKARHGSVNSVRWSISKQEVEKNNVLVCVLIQEEINQRQDQYHLILAGFLPTDLIKDSIQKRVIEIRAEQAFVSIDDLLYGGGLQAYLEFSQFIQFKEQQTSDQSPSILNIANPMSALTLGSWKRELSLEDLSSLETAIIQIKENYKFLKPKVQNSDASTNSLEELWQCVLENIELRGTQTLLGQQCHLITIEKQQARIGVHQKALMKVVQRSLPIVEEAFLKCLGIPIKVGLVVEPKTD